MSEIVHPKSKEHWLELRTNDVTSTEISSLFNLSPYMTLFELWHRKKNKHIVLIEENERMRWGNRLEDAIARGVAEDEGWIVEPMKSYMRKPELKIGSSFDYFIGTDGILEIKNVDSLAYRDGWSTDDDGNIEAPPHIELQVQHQLAVSDRKFAYIAALVGGNRVALIKREPDQEIINAIKNKVADFWKSIDCNIEPNPDFEKDAEIIRQLNNYAEPGKVIDANQRVSYLAGEYLAYCEQIKELENKRDAAKTEMITLIGDAEKIKGEQFTISAGMVAESQISFTRKPYRNFRISWKKK